MKTNNKNTKTIKVTAAVASKGAKDGKMIQTETLPARKKGKPGVRTGRNEFILALLKAKKHTLDYIALATMKKFITVRRGKAVRLAKKLALRLKKAGEVGGFVTVKA